MPTAADRFRTVAAGFGARADAVTDWDVPSPCAGWSARDIVDHMVGWFPSFLAQGAGDVLPAGPPVATDPAGAWHALAGGVQSLLDDPATANRRFGHPHVGDHPLPDAITTFFLGDVLVHTWDLARATGQDEAYDDALRVGGQYGPKVDVAPDATPQDRLLAFLGRRP